MSPGPGKQGRGLMIDVGLSSGLAPGRRRRAIDEGRGRGRRDAQWKRAKGRREGIRDDVAGQKRGERPQLEPRAYDRSAPPERGYGNPLDEMGALVEAQGRLIVEADDAVVARRVVIGVAAIGIAIGRAMARERVGILAVV